MTQVIDRNLGRKAEAQSADLRDVLKRLGNKGKVFFVDLNLPHQGWKWAKIGPEGSWRLWEMNQR